MKFVHVRWSGPMLLHFSITYEHYEQISIDLVMVNLVRENRLIFKINSLFTATLFINQWVASPRLG
jgi:hypothetical protein